MTISIDDNAFHSELRKVRGRFKPRSPNSLAFLFSALSPVRTAEQFFTDVDVESCNWIHIFALASNWLVAPLLFARLQQKQLTGCCPEDFLAALEAFHEANSERNARHREILLEALILLNQVGITPQLLKGAHALVGKMPDHKERVIGDIDLLIPLEQINLARTTLINSGFYHEEVFSGAVAESNEDDNLHHLSPLFHPSGRGYIELHRFPSYSKHYPAVVPQCFIPENMLSAEEEGAKFFYNHPWQLLFYNQVHHYYSAIDIKGLLDIRHLAEQSALVNQIDNLESLERYSDMVFLNNASSSNLQFKLLAALFGHNLPLSRLTLNRNDQINYRDVLSILQGAQFPLQKRKIFLLAHLIWQLIKSGRIKRRLFNISWYRSRPKAFHAIFK